MGLDLVTIWMLVITFTLMIYVVLDGFDLGLGLLFAAVRNRQEREVILKTVSPVWDGNEGWLALCGMGFLLAFPVAFTIIFEALFIPISAMIVGLLLRGVAFKYRFRASSQDQRKWDILFFIGSFTATFMQGATLGAVVQGITVENLAYKGGEWEWLSWFSILTGISLVIAYALLGATWLLFNIQDELHTKIRQYSHYLLVWLGYAATAILLVTPFLNEALKERWFTLPNFFYLGFVPMLGLMLFTWAYYVVRFSEWNRWPFAIILTMFGTAYFTLITTVWPYIVPPDLSFYKIAAPQSSLRLSIWAMIIAMPILLIYSYWSYFLYRGKTLFPNAAAY